MNLVVHPLTEQRLEQFGQAPSHAVLLVGPRGSGKSSLAERLAEDLLDLPVGKFESYPYKTIIIPEEGRAISIEAVRELEHFLSLRVPGTGDVSRIVIVKDSQLLTDEAQNAFLKILEEPPAGTVMILTATFVQALLPTIRSRVQTVEVLAPGRKLIDDYFAQQGFDNQLIQQTRIMSGGLPGLMNSLLRQDDHPLRQATEQARQLLSQTTYERLLQADELAKQKQLLMDTLFILQQMAHVSLRTATGASAGKWRRVLEASYLTT